METSGSNTDPYRNSSSGNGLRRYGVQFSASNFIQAPLTALLEYSGIFRGRSSHQESEALINGGVGTGLRDHMQTRLEESVAGTGGGEVAIRIIGAGEQEHIRAGPALSVAQGREGGSGETGASPESVVGPDRQSDGGGTEGGSTRGGASSSSGVAPADSANGSADGETGNGTGANNRDSSYQRYDIQQAARWIEQILPFSLLLLVVFIRQHLQGNVQMSNNEIVFLVIRWLWIGFEFKNIMSRSSSLKIRPMEAVQQLIPSMDFFVQGFFVTIWIAAVMFKSNDILRKQTALKGERKFSVLVGITLVFILHVVGVYWWYRNDDLLYPLVMLPPKEIPPFWHAVFIIMVNDTMVRQAAMVLKCILLMYYKNNRGRNYRKQGQMLTLVEYLLLLYRALLPTPVWYRFFLNKEYGSLFSSLTTGLYLTFKLTSVVEKVQSFFTAVKALSRKEVHYGSYATTEQVIAAGDLCAICQEKMHAPILLRCKHIFCEDCVSEWFERERTCPLCRALVKPADLRSFGDGSTSLFFQLF